MRTGTGQRRQTIAATLALVVFGLALIGLRGQVAAAGDTATASRAATVSIVDFAFKPGTLTVPKGSTVTFSNTSDMTHTATREGSFDTGPIKPGRSASIHLGRRGTFRFHCLIHPSMHGKIVVE
jgi:plastocyanin